MENPMALKNRRSWNWCSGNEKSVATTNGLWTNKPVGQKSGTTVEHALYGQGKQKDIDTMDGKSDGSNKCGRPRKTNYRANTSNGTVYKTPLSLLYEIVSKAGERASLEFFERPSNRDKLGIQLFEYSVQVVTATGEILQEIGYGTTKQSAKHDAARRMIVLINPDAEVLMLASDKTSPQQFRSDNVKDNFIFPSTARGGNQSSYSSHRSHGGLQDTSLKSHYPMQKNEGRDGGVDVSQIADKLIITVKLPENDHSRISEANQQSSSNNQQIRAQTRRLSLLDKVDIVKCWEGPKIEKLKGYTIPKLLEIKNPVKVAEMITEEQNFCLEYIFLDGEARDGFKPVCTCILESRPKGEFCAFFTDYGCGSNPEEAQMNAAGNFVRMLKLMIDSI